MASTKHYCRVVDGYVTNVALFEGDMPAGWAPAGEVWIQNDQAGPGWAYAGAGVFIPPAPPAPPPPTSYDVNSERDRRIALPCPIALPDGRTFSVNMADDAMRNMQGLATAALLSKMSGSTAPLDFITYENTVEALSPDDIIAMGVQVQARITALTFIARQMKDSGIPADFTDDSHWVSE